MQPVLRGIGIAVAACLFASPILQSLHEAEVRHIACPDDGELIDAPTGSPHPHARTPLDGPALFREREPAGQRTGREGHDHCALVLRTRAAARSQPSRQLSIELPSTAPTAFDPRTPVLHSLAVYRFAPKASPPLR